jgi:hypothetical protein
MADGPLPDPRPMKRIATFVRRTRAGGEPYYISKGTPHDGRRLIFVLDERGLPGEYVLLMAENIEPERRR